MTKSQKGLLFIFIAGLISLVATLMTTESFVNLVKLPTIVPIIFAGLAIVGVVFDIIGTFMIRKGCFSYLFAFICALILMVATIVDAVFTGLGIFEGAIISETAVQVLTFLVVFCILTGTIDHLVAPGAKKFGKVTRVILCVGYLLVVAMSVLAGIGGGQEWAAVAVTIAGIVSATCIGIANLFYIIFLGVSFNKVNTK